MNPGDVNPADFQIGSSERELNEFCKKIISGSEMYQDPSSGHVYRKSTHKDVKANHSLTSVQQYVMNLPTDALIIAQRPDKEVPYEGIDDFVSTLRNACSPTGVFKWPCTSMNFQKAVAVALHHCPPGHMVVLKNAVPTPETLRDPQTSRRRSWR